MFQKSLSEIIQDADRRSQQSLAESKAAAKVRMLPWISVEQALPQNDSTKKKSERRQYLVKLLPSGEMAVATFGHENHDLWIDMFGHLLIPEYGYKVTGWCPLPSSLGVIPWTKIRPLLRLYHEKIRRVHTICNT